MLTLNDGRSELWQWDTGRKLTVDAECTQVHFSNKVFGRSVDVDVVDGFADIPDFLLQSDKDLTAWAFVGTGENGYTKISKVFKVNKRNKPSDYVFTPTEQITLEEIKERLDNLEVIPDPDAIKIAVEDYLEHNPVEPGYTPQRGIDYYTEEDKANILADVLEAIPAADWVEYIESDGTQYINTGFVPGGDTKVVIDAEYVNETHSGADALFGARDGTSANFVLLRPGSSSTTLRSDYNATMDATFPAVGSDRAVYTKDHGFTYMNGELVSTVPEAKFSSKYAMYLMAVNSQNSARFPGAVRIYSCQIYDNGKLVRDFIPWRTLNGTVGLYDRVHGKLYTDANGGKFGWGAKAGTTVSGMAQYATEAEVQTMIADALAGITNVSGVAM